MTNNTQLHITGGEELIRLVRDGDASAMTRLIKHHRDPLHKYIARLIPEAAKRYLEADDILQETMFLAFRRIATFTQGGDEEFRRWIFTIARHCLVDHIRARESAKRSGEQLSNEVDSDGSIACLLEELAVYKRTPSQSAASHELIFVIEEALGRIPEDYGIALRLRYLDQLTVAETAAKIGKTERAVHMLCNRGLKTLRLEMRSGGRFL